MYDLKIKNAKIVDGTGLKAFHGDIGVIDNLIVDRGKNLGIAKRNYNKSRSYGTLHSLDR